MGRFCKEGFKVCFFFQLSFQFLLAIPCQPANDFIDFFFRSFLFIYFIYVMGIDTLETYCINFLFRHDRSLTVYRFFLQGTMQFPVKALIVFQHRGSFH